MNPTPITSRQIPNLGYRHTRILLEDFQATTHWLVLEEGLERPNEYGVIIPDQKASTTGKILACGPEAVAAGLSVGDEVIYEAWMGGRWAFTTIEYRTDNMGETCRCGGRFNENHFMDDIDGTLHCDFCSNSINHWTTQYEEKKVLIISLDHVWVLL